MQTNLGGTKHFENEIADIMSKVDEDKCDVHLLSCSLFILTTVSVAPITSIK
jgi:hypothetical protein